MKKVTKNLLLLWLLALAASSLVGYFGTRQPPPPLVPGKDISTGTFFQLYLLSLAKMMTDFEINSLRTGL